MVDSLGNGQDRDRERRQGSKNSNLSLEQLAALHIAPSFDVAGDTGTENRNNNGSRDRDRNLGRDEYKSSGYWERGTNDSLPGRQSSHQSDRQAGLEMLLSMQKAGAVRARFVL